MQVIEDIFFRLLATGNELFDHIPFVAGQAGFHRSEQPEDNFSVRVVEVFTRVNHDKIEVVVRDQPAQDFYRSSAVAATRLVQLIVEYQEIRLMQM